LGIKILPGTVPKLRDVAARPKIFFNKHVLVMNSLAGKRVGLSTNGDNNATLSLSEDKDKLIIKFFVTAGPTKEMFPIRLGAKNGMFYLSLYDYIRNPDFFKQPTTGEKLSVWICEHEFGERALTISVDTTLKLK
jgi:hypothetical protein